MKEKASVTVTMTLVLFMVLSLILVTLEHDYAVCGRTLALQVFDKSLESVLGYYYAPLFAEYGLLAVCVGSGFEMENSREIEKAVEENFNHVFEDGSLWDYKLRDTSVTGAITLADDDGDEFVSQIREAVLCEKIAGFGGELSGLIGMDASGLDGVLSGDENEENSEEPEGSVKEVIDTLKTFLKEGPSGLWFEDTSGISTKRLDVSDLPSRTEGNYDSSDEDDLFVLPGIGDVLTDSDDYINELSDGDFFSGFLSEGAKLAEDLGDKAALTAYAGMKMDNYIKNDYKAGAVNYEQEYLIFGTPSDNLNVRRAAAAVFGIRFGAALIYIFGDAEAQAELDEWLGVFNLGEKLRLALKGLAGVVWAMLNATVETAALLKGKKVNFSVSRDTLKVQLSEILSLTKTRIMYRAEHYTGSGGFKLEYKNYLSVFTFLTDRKKLSYRMMDIIEANMRKNYNAGFRIKNAMLGFSCSAETALPPKFLSLTAFDRSGDYECRIESAVFIS